jgi:UDP-GlcNAc:undecaprenyl-phosphate GlcNAc-1-phosphate transferase
MSGVPWQGGLIALGVTVVAMPAVLAGLRRADIVDVPNERSSHRAAVPRGGGLAPAIGVVAALVVLAVEAAGAGEPLVAVVAVAAGFGAIGAADDLVGLGPRLRLGLQGLVASAALVGLAEGLSGSLAWMVVFCVGVVVWLAAYVNAFNFMDGINGIAAAQAVVAGGAWWVIGAAQHIVPLAAGGAIALGAAAGFAPFNAPKARVFLGDVGSYFFGGLLAALVVVGLRAGLPPEAVVAPLGLYLADTATTIVRRVRAGETWHQAHRRHVYQRLTQAGWSHMATTGLVALSMVVVSALGAVSLTGNLAARAAADAAIVVVLAAYLAAPAIVARRVHSGDVVRPYGEEQITLRALPSLRDEA